MIVKYYKRIMLFSACVIVCILAIIFLTREKPNSINIADVNNVDYWIEIIRGNINPDFPGFGMTDYGIDDPRHIAKSYAFMLRAELIRQRNDLWTSFPNLANVAGMWLLDNARLSEQGHVGWGGGLIWDPYGDGSENPEHTVYTISNGIVVDALLDWAEYDETAPRQLIFDTLWAMAEHYLEPEMRTPAGLLPYSLLPQDRPYDTLNSAAYLAGQFQRLASYLDDERADRLQTAADETMRVLLDNYHTSEQGYWYWYYSLDEQVPNDIAHASYIVKGIQDYINYGGQYGNEFDLNAVVMHFSEFLSENRQVVYGWPQFRTDTRDPARLYDIGMLLYMTCSYEALQDQYEDILTIVPDYLDTNRGFLKYPRNSQFKNLVVNEYEVYLFLGLTACHAHGDVSSSLNPIEQAEIDSLTEIPFVYPNPNNRSIRSFFNPQTAEIQLIDLQTNSATEPKLAVPVVQYETQDGYLWTLERVIPTQEIVLIVDTGNQQLERVIQHTLDDENVNVIFRGAGVTGNEFVLVYYDNPSQYNYVVRFIVQDDEIYQLVSPYQIPALEDPAGATYEMIPAVFVMTQNEAIHIVGGRTYVWLDGQDNWSHRRLDSCEKALETVMGDVASIILCQTDANSDMSPFIVVDIEANTVTQLNVDEGIPWGITYNSAEGIHLNFAKTISDFTEMISFDIERLTQTGWMEFGINNNEGRIPWSQIYYLNGFLDMIYLAGKSSTANELLSPLLPSIRERLDLELGILDQMWADGYYYTRAFTVDRSPALFSVQTSRLLLLMHRYLHEVEDPIFLNSYEDIRETVRSLNQHIEIMAYDGQPNDWLASGRPYLMWPYGSGFPFDGLNVPYNHQNEWAYSIVETRDSLSEDDSVLADATDILRFFIEQVAPDGNFPLDGQWYYWWGQAFEGWAIEDNISVNRPEYRGDRGLAWISFKSIDVMSVLSAIQLISEDTMLQDGIIDSVHYLTEQGLLYPFVSYSLAQLDRDVIISRDVAQRYARVSSVWEIQSGVWAWYSLVRLDNQE
jgi:hypothetical protein